MKKLLALGCTIAFVMFWIFGGLSILAYLDAHPLFPAVTIIALISLALGAWARLRLVALTPDLRRGTRVTVAPDEAAQTHHPA